MYIKIYSGRYTSFLFSSVYTKRFSGVQYIQIGKIPQSRYQGSNVQVGDEV